MPGPGAALYLIMGGVYLIVGSQLTCLGISFASMMADATDEHDYLFGDRREGLYFSSLTFSGKCALGAGALIAGVSLDLIGFPKDLATSTAVEIPSSTVLHLGLIYGPAAAVIMFVAAVVLMRYRLNRKEFARLQTQLRNRQQ
jgi:GPH family glycoside/pentoside/hexuronide:cation symporter